MTARLSGSAARLTALLAALALAGMACVPTVPTPTPATSLQNRPPTVPDTVIQAASPAPTPLSGPIAGATPANPGAGAGYPPPESTGTAVSRPAPAAAYP